MRGIVAIFVICMLVLSPTPVFSTQKPVSNIHIKLTPTTGNDDIKIGSVVIDGNRKFVSATTEGLKMMGGAIGIITKRVSGDFNMYIDYSVNLRDGIFSPPDLGVIGVYRLQGAKSKKS